MLESTRASVEVLLRSLFHLLYCRHSIPVHSLRTTETDIKPVSNLHINREVVEWERELLG